MHGNPTGNVITRDTARVAAQPAARDSLVVPTRTEIPLKIPTFRCISSLSLQVTAENIILPSRPLLLYNYFWVIPGAGELPKSNYTTFKTRRNFEIKKIFTFPPAMAKSP